MHINILRCDWCGSEKEYDPYHHQTLTFTRIVKEWGTAAVDKYEICDVCAGIFIQLVMRRQAVADQ